MRVDPHAHLDVLTLGTVGQRSDVAFEASLRPSPLVDPDEHCQPIFKTHCQTHRKVGRRKPSQPQRASGDGPCWGGSPHFTQRTL